MRDSLGDKARLQHIIESITLIEKCISDITIDEFLSDFKTKLAVHKLFEIIGEACNHLSEEITFSKSNTIPWAKIVGLRNLLTHEYFRVDYKIIFEVCKNEIVPFKLEIENIYNDLPNID